MFLMVMRKFNSNQSLPQKTVAKFEAYFQYRWKHDRQLAISQRPDIELLEQLPKTVQTDIYMEFLFKKYL